MPSTCGRRLRSPDGGSIAAEFFIPRDTLAFAFLPWSCLGLSSYFLVAALALTLVSFSPGNVQLPVTSLPRFGDRPRRVTEDLVQRQIVSDRSLICVRPCQGTGPREKKLKH